MDEGVRKPARGHPGIHTEPDLTFNFGLLFRVLFFFFFCINVCIETLLQNTIYLYDFSGAPLNFAQEASASLTSL